ncbi:MAG: DUF932 domain-containing protein [Lachnospiraceae bacterium]|nr:DUF932 domain-containing protein [Lachnospiraceae bacterium]
MAANVETMFYVRETPWHGLGTMVQEALTSADALRLAGLDWQVTQKPIQVCGGKTIDNYKANLRSTDGKVLGVVSDRYQIVQNVDAFSFTDELIGGDVRYETAGSLQEGKKVWMLAKMPTTKIVGDDVEPYLCFSNTHDGSGAIRVCMTPIRVVCNNTLNLAFNGAKRQWSTRHVGDLKYKMQEARLCLELAEQYMDGLATYADKLANTTISDEQIDKLLAEMFPVDEDKDGERKKNSAKKAKEEFMICYFRPDIAKFLNTGWGVVNAMSDMVTHTAPRRQTANYQENNWNRIMDGHKMLDKMVELVGVR